MPENARLSTPLRAAIVAVSLVGIAAAAVVAARGGFAAVAPWRWAMVPACGAGILLAEAFPVKIGPEQKVNLGALPCLVAALLLPPGIGPGTAAAGSLLANRLARRTWWEAGLNGGNVLLAASLAAGVGAVARDVDVTAYVRATAAGGVYVAVNLLVAVLPVAIHMRRRYVSVLWQAFEATWPASVTLAGCAVSIAILSVQAPFAAPLPLIVLPLIYRMNRAIEAQASANARLEAVLAAQRRFLTDVSHQVATPLATIMTNLWILRRSTRDGAAGEAVADSVAEAERMKRMLARLRALAHADEDVPLRRELVDLAELTADIVRAFAAPAGTSGVSLTTEVTAAPRVSADKDLLREAVANLVDNAVKVSPRGASVKLRVEDGSGVAKVAVIDNGPGIEPARLTTIFERFQRSDSGSGLGLAIARRVVERHGGTIRVDTHQGAGSTFTIELPE